MPEGSNGLKTPTGPRAPSLLGQILFGIAVAAGTALARVGIDRVLPGSSAFVFFAPAVLLSTLVASWRAGAVTLAIITYLAWRFLLAPAGFNFSHPADDVSLSLQVGSYVLVIVVAQAFRVASRMSLAARTERLQQRDLLFRELDHRVKNTFALIASMVDLQRRRATEPAAQEALTQVSTRLLSIAAAHRELYRGDDVSKIDLVVYLTDLCKNLSTALFTDASSKLVTDLEGRVRVARDRAVALGLILNELVTNAAKYARGQEATVVTVKLRRSGPTWVLSVADNGPGLPDNPSPSSGMGQGLITALLKQADASLDNRNDNGAIFDVAFKA
ncbi:MAG: sensor histidine kinase [Vitreimonas sp.]